MSLKGSNPSPCLKALNSITYELDNSRFVRVFDYQSFGFTGNKPSIETVLALIDQRRASDRIFIIYGDPLIVSGRLRAG